MRFRTWVLVMVNFLIWYSILLELLFNNFRTLTGHPEPSIVIAIDFFAFFLQFYIIVCAILALGQKEKP